MPTITLYIRPTLPNGTRPYLEPVYFNNKRLRGGYALVDGKAVPFPGAPYALRYVANGKRRFEQVGSDPDQALIALANRRHALQAVDLGLPVPTGFANTADEPKRLLSDAVTEYLAETASHKSVKTLAAYTTTLTTFVTSCSKPYLEDVIRKDLLDYITALKARGNGPRTVRNRIDFLQIFLHHYGLPSILKGKDLPKFTEKEVRAYSAFDMGKLFGFANREESDLLMFFLCTGVREQEAQFACWSDVDLAAKTFTVTEKLDLSFRPKDKEEGAIPIPAALVELLQERRKRSPKTRLIFPGSNGKPNGHFLRVVKRLALRAGLNCGECVNKKGRSCADHPTCNQVDLHRLRKTFATMHHKNGMPVRTIMRFLRHSSLDTTLKYLADAHDEQTRNVVESTFVRFAPCSAK